MGGVSDAIQWTGTSAIVSLFVVSRSAATPRVTMVHRAIAPSQVRSYQLIDEEVALAGQYIHEFDAEFDGVPTDLESYLRDCLAEALQAGGRVVWLGFEGSFDFRHLLTDDIATEIYGVGDVDGVAVVLADDQIMSRDWLDRVRSARSRLAVDVLPTESPRRERTEDE
jgi:hypothetical protein